MAHGAIVGLIGIAIQSMEHGIDMEITEGYLELWLETNQII